MESISGADNFEYEGFKYSKEEIIGMINKATAHIEKGGYKKAHDIYSTLIETIPHSAAFHFSRSIVSMNLKDREGTISDMEKAIEMYELQENYEIANNLKRMVENLRESDAFERPSP